MQLLASLNWVSHRVPSSPACRMETSKIENVRSIHSKEVLRLLRRFTHTHTFTRSHSQVCHMQHCHMRPHNFNTQRIVTGTTLSHTHNSLTHTYTPLHTTCTQLCNKHLSFISSSFPIRPPPPSSFLTSPFHVLPLFCACWKKLVLWFLARPSGPNIVI